MYSKLIITIFTLVGATAYGQQDEYEDVEVIEKNVSRDADADSVQEDYSKSMNEAYDTKNSPQINIYNANSNANKQHQKSKMKADADAASETVSDMNSNTEAGNEYIMRANDIRRNRKDMEVGTEQKMIEKIEYSRIEDERDRANRLFGNRLDKNYNDDYKHDKAPQVIVVEKQPEYTPVKPVKPTYENEVYADDASDWWGQETYISPMIGKMNYSSDNVSADSAIGVALGMRYDTNVSIEGSFLYSTLEMQDYRIGYVDDMGNSYSGLKDVSQYGFGLGVKYNAVSFGRVSPFIGALAAYTYREYTETRIGNGEADSTAIDAGINFGADFKISKNLSVGAEYRWMKNISFDRNESVDGDLELQSLPPEFEGKSKEALEEVGYSAFLVNGKFSF